MPIIDEVCRFLEQFAPPSLAEEWDNVGLLVGCPGRSAGRIMTCLTVTVESVSEAVDEQANLIVTHHPLPFRPLKRITTTEGTPGKLLMRLLESHIAVYSPHTAFDSAAGGINRQLAEGLGLTEIAPLRPAETSEGDGEAPIGAGRFGRLPQPLSLRMFAERVKAFLSLERLQLVGDPDRPVQKIAVACGSAGEFLESARRLGCEVLVTGETNFHTCLEAEATGMGLVLPGHYASERFALERLAEVLALNFPSAHVWASRREADPLRWV